MISSKVALFSILALCIDGRKWYSVRDNGDFQESNQMKSSISFESGKSGNYEYIPLVTHNSSERRKDNSLKDDHEFKPSDPLQISHLMESVQVTKPEDIVGKETKYLQLRNNIVNTNIVHLGRQKRPLRRRCRQVMRKPKNAANATMEGRFLEVFEIVQFDHVACSSSNGLEGTCLHPYDCQKTGGTAMGTCADGYGTCCVSK